MQRELKFRIWNVIEGKWNGIYNQDPKMVGELCCHKGIYLIPESTSKNLIVQQSTGLLDKNGKEIYEGDIVKAISDQYENENFVGKVIFDEGCFLTWVNKNDIRGIWGDDDIEVIGNIFENSEILEK